MTQSFVDLFLIVMGIGDTHGIRNGTIKCKWFS